MIEAMIFDLDGTLVQTERLKALSYAAAARALRPELEEGEVLEAFKEVVGRSREEVAAFLLARFDLGPAAQAASADLGVKSGLEAFLALRLQAYEAMLHDPKVLLENRWPHNLALLEAAWAAGCKVGLATMSRRSQVLRVLEVLGLENAFDVVATRDDVRRGKPDPEIYLLVARRLGVARERCLVVEDSPSGVEAALRAGMHVVAVATPFTRRALHEAGLIPAAHIVDDPADLPAVVTHLARHMASQAADANKPESTE